jgi:isopenicillin N synthase-like dioxygenase
LQRSGMSLTADIHPIPLALVETDLAAAAAGFGDAFARTGFAVVSDHGIDQGLIARANDATRAFFALPDVVKRRYVVPGGGGQRGLTPCGVEAAKGHAAADLKEFWHVGRELPAGHPYADVMPAIAVHLGLAPDFFVDPVRDGNSILRLLHYPPVAAETAGAIRAGAHEDINVITLLLGAEEKGLQLLGKDGEWRFIDAPEGSLVCNVGDMLQRLTGHRLPSTTHRVVNPAPERMGVARFSTPFFLHFRPDYLITALPGGPHAEPPITANDYLLERLRDIKLL